MGKNGRVLLGSDALESRRLWFGELKEEELQETLQTLLGAGLVQMTLKGKERAFRLTILGEARMIASST
jgi:hypothetical protein